MNGFPFLSVLTAAPAVGAVIVALLPRSKPSLANQTRRRGSFRRARPKRIRSWLLARVLAPNRTGRRGRRAHTDQADR